MEVCAFSKAHADKRKVGFDMSYVALYRKFRPTDFSEVKGQEHIVTTLQNQIKTGRIGHAYLFCGTRGTGKTTIAKIMAKAVNCLSPVDGNPCGECEMCKRIAAQTAMNVIEIDAASNNGVDNIREIIEEVSYRPADGGKKVYIIDEVHMLSTGAFNALLKTLEEPPEYVMFILATTDPQKLPITILSRCQRYDFRRIGIDTISARIDELLEAENIKAEPEAVGYIAKMADGSMRDALSLLDQCIAFHIGEDLTYDMVLEVLGAVDAEVFVKLTKGIMAGDVKAVISVLDEVIYGGKELPQFVNDYIWYLRNMMLLKTSDITADTLGVSTDTYKQLKAQSEQLDLDAITKYIFEFSELANNIKYASQKRVLAEVTLIKLCRPQMSSSDDSVLQRVRSIEQRLDSGEFTVRVEGAAEDASPKKPAFTEEEKKALVKAMPEEVVTICRNWEAIKESFPPLMKTHLNNCELSMGEENKLILVAKDFLPFDYFSREENENYVKDALEKYLGKAIEISVTKVPDGKDFEDSFINIRGLVNMDMENI